MVVPPENAHCFGEPTLLGGHFFRKRPCCINLQNCSVFLAVKTTTAKNLGGAVTAKVSLSYLVHGQFVDYHYHGWFTKYRFMIHHYIICNKLYTISLFDFGWAIIQPTWVLSPAKPRIPQNPSNWTLLGFGRNISSSSCQDLDHWVHHIFRNSDPQLRVRHWCVSFYSCCATEILISILTFLLRLIILDSSA